MQVVLRAEVGGPRANHDWGRVMAKKPNLANNHAPHLSSQLRSNNSKTSQKCKCAYASFIDTPDLLLS